MVHRRLDCLCGTERRCDEQLPRVHFQAPDMAKSRMPQGVHLETGQLDGLMGDCWAWAIFFGGEWANGICQSFLSRQIQENLVLFSYFLKDSKESRMCFSLTNLVERIAQDTNGAPHRYVTALIYLDTLPASGDGATTFPCAMAPEPVQRAGRELYNQGGQHTSNVSDPELETLAQELLDASEEYCGFSALPEQGKLVLFFTRGDDGAVDPMSWHGGARVSAAGDFGGKWMLQIFKTLPPEIRSQKDLLKRFSARCRRPPEFVCDKVCHRLGTDLLEAREKVAASPQNFEPSQPSLPYLQLRMRHRLLGPESAVLEKWSP